MNIPSYFSVNKLRHQEANRVKMQKLQDSVFSIVKTTNLSPAVFSYLQPSDDFPDKTPLGGILSDTNHGWLALGPKFCVVDLRTGLKVAQRTFGASLSNYRTTVTCVVELPTPLTNNSQQLIISLECEDIAGMICIFHINGSQILRGIQTEVVVTELAVCNGLPDGPFTCFDGAVMAGTKSGELFVFDLNRSCLIQALKDISQGYEHLIHDKENLASLSFLPLNAVHQIEAQRDLAVENDDHIAVLLNENSLVDGQYIFRNPDGTVRMKAKRDHIRVTVVQYIPQLGSLAVGFNFGAFQIWNLLNLDLEFTSQVNVECLPVTHFGFQEPCDDPRAFCYIWVVFSVIDRFDEEEFPLAVMYSLTYQGKRMLSDTKCLYQEFLTATVRFQVELSTSEEASLMVGGRCVSCHTYCVNSMLGSEGEDSMLNICQLVWECWGESDQTPAQYGMLLFDLDQWYKDQMPDTYRLQSNAFMSVSRCAELSPGAAATLDVRLAPRSLAAYCAAARLEEHFYPNSLRYECICLNTSEACVLGTPGIQRQIVSSMDEVGPTALLNPTKLYHACVRTGLVPLYLDNSLNVDQEEQRRYLLSVALEARLSRFLRRCAHDWATGSHIGAGCTLTFLVDWCWKRAIELKENARELTAPLFTSSSLPDRNVVRCLEHCVQQLTQLTQLLDAVLTKCCNLVVPEALSEMEEKYKGIGIVSLYFQVVQWFTRAGLLPERLDAGAALPYPRRALRATYTKRRLKLHRLQDSCAGDENAGQKSCPLLYIDQLIEQEFGGERIHEMWQRAGSECGGLYPPPSLHSLLRLYLLPAVAEQHKHSLVLYLLVDYSMLYDEVRYESVIRRLMQFPTMFGLSNTAIKATQAFWHLDHRDFDFALDQLQCLTGNTLSDWQHNVVLSSLLAQKKTQAALQYLHVRKPPPIQSNDPNSSKVNDHDKLDDWQSCCNLYLARGLVYEALDVIRMCVRNAGSLEDKTHVLNFFFKGCRNTGHLSKILKVSLLPFEEEVFIKYLENCNESQTWDILIMYFLQQARYLEAEQYNNRLKLNKHRIRDVTASAESLADVTERDAARDTLVEVLCSSLPAITSTVAHTAIDYDVEPHTYAPKPMSVYVQARSPKNRFTYKSSFIQATIGNASETWINRPKARKGMKRALNIEETPFLCTPKLARSHTVFKQEADLESTPPKRARLDLSGTPKTPRNRAADKISLQMSALLDMPDIHSPDLHMYDRRGAETPHSILKTRGGSARDAASPASPASPASFRADSDDELLETASNHTHYSDSTNKHLRFTIPTASESGSTPSPPSVPVARGTETDRSNERSTVIKERDVDMSFDSCVTTQSHAMTESNPLESPPKKQAIEEKILSRKSLKDSVKGRLSLSISANSSLSEDPNTSVESIADWPITLINPRCLGEKRRSYTKDVENTETASLNKSDDIEMDSSKIEAPKTPSCRRSIRAVNSQSTPKINRSRLGTPERVDSPTITTPLKTVRNTRSRSRTPEISPRSSPLEPIIELPRLEVASEPHPQRTALSVPRAIRSRSRTPERTERAVESPRLEAITESPAGSSESPVSSPVSSPSRRNLRNRSRTPERTERAVESPRLEAVSESPARSLESHTSSPVSSPTRRNLRSRSRTPEVEVPEKPIVERKSSSRSLRSRSKTPEKLLSPKKDAPKSAKKSLSRLVLEANTIAASKNLGKLLESPDVDNSVVECTPMKALKSVTSLMDVTISPIAAKSVLHSSNESVFSESVVKETKSDESVEMKSLPAFTMNETKFGKSVLRSYESSVAETSQEGSEIKIDISVSKVEVKSLPAFTLSESYFEKSVLHSYESSVAETSSFQVDNAAEHDKEIRLKPARASTTINVSDFGKPVLGSPETSLADSDDKSKDIAKPNMSSLMTSDSEIEEWKAENQSNQDVIQKEKEKIVEIEREINEIENEMSDDDQSVSDSDEMVVDTDGEVEDEEAEDEEAENGSGEDEESGDAEENSEDSGSDDDDATSADSVISIVDSDESLSSNSNNPTQGVPQEKEAFTNIKEVVEGVEIQEDSNSATDKLQDTERSDDPLNQVSLLTDDNSIHLDRSETIRDYFNEKMDEQTNTDDGGGKDVVVESEAMEPEPIEINISVEIVNSTVADKKDDTQKSHEPTHLPIKTDVVDKTSTEKATIKETKIDDGGVKDVVVEAETVESEPIQIDIAVEIVPSTGVVKETKTPKSLEPTPLPIKTAEPTHKAAKVPMVVDIVETAFTEKSIVIDKPVIEELQTIKSIDSLSEAKGTKQVTESSMQIESKDDLPKTNSTNEPKPVSEPSKEIESKYDLTLANVQTQVNKTEQTKDNQSKSSVDEDTPQVDVRMKADKEENTVPKMQMPATRSKRTKSTSSNKSYKESAIENVEPKTPVTRKRSISTTVVEEQKTPEEKNAEATPSRRRAKTPTSTEVRKILTRRASKELSEKLDDSLASVDDNLTPRRRSTRARSRAEDDVISMASESSVKSSISKVSEDAGDGKPRRGRKSALVTKPDLSVIPETTVEDSSKAKDEIIANYSMNRRLTRNQKSMLESWLDPKSSTPRATPRRKTSVASRSSAISEQSHEDDDTSSTHSSAFNVEPIDRMTLMNRQDFEGSPDPSEGQSNVSPESIASDATKQRSRLNRALSESKTTPKARKITKRVASLDIADNCTEPPAGGSPPPARGRRASFTRACEALLTPRARRASGDARKGDADSPAGSPAPRRRASQDTGKRSRRLSAVDENKDTKI